MTGDLGYRIPGVGLIDIECVCCGTRLVELTGADAAIALIDHECLEGELLHLQAAAADDLGAACRMLSGQWKRIA